MLSTYYLLRLMNYHIHILLAQMILKGIDDSSKSTASWIKISQWLALAFNSTTILRPPQKMIVMKGLIIS